MKLKTLTLSVPIPAWRLSLMQEAGRMAYHRYWASYNRNCRIHDPAPGRAVRVLVVRGMDNRALVPAVVVPPRG